MSRRRISWRFLGCRLLASAELLENADKLAYAFPNLLSIGSSIAKNEPASSRFFLIANRQWHNGDPLSKNSLGNIHIVNPGRQKIRHDR
jgi:hypothetical protein